MTEFVDVGAHCSVDFCKQQDFLPFTCDACNQQFCLEHRTYKAHNCRTHQFKDAKHVFCPECHQSVSTKPGEDLDEKLAIHMSSHDCKPLQQQQRLSAATGAKKQTQMSKQCAVKNCKEKDAIGVGLVRCPLCRKEYCLRHRLENAHKCPRAGDTRAARRAADQRAVMQRQRQQQDTGSDDCLILWIWKNTNYFVVEEVSLGLLKEKESWSYDWVADMEMDRRFWTLMKVQTLLSLSKSVPPRRGMGLQRIGQCSATRETTAFCKYSWIRRQEENRGCSRKERRS